jgi:hypothetical protein
VFIDCGCHSLGWVHEAKSKGVENVSACSLENFVLDH